MADDAAAPSRELSEPATELAEPAEKLDDDTVEQSGTEVPDGSDHTGDEAETDLDEGAAAPRTPMSHVRLATIAGLIVVLALAGLSGWLGYRAHQSNQVDDQRRVFVQVGRQGALNLTSIDYQHVDADVTRILDSATGTFYDDFQQRSKPFAEVVTQVKSKSVGTVTEAGLESETPDSAQVLVAVTVNTVVEGQPEQQPRAWRMRITVQKTADDVKVSNVEFVP